MRHLYLVTNVDKSMVEAIWEKTATEVAFFVGTSPVVSASPWQPFETEAPLRSRASSAWAMCPTASTHVRCRRTSRTKIYLVAFRSQLAEQVYVRSVLFSYLTAFLVTLAASLFLATGFTSLAVSPFTRLSHWLHRYMDTGEMGKLDIRSRDEIGFLAGHVPRNGEHADQREERHQRPAGPDQPAERLQRAHHERHPRRHHRHRVGRLDRVLQRVLRRPRGGGSQCAERGAAART